MKKLISLSIAFSIFGTLLLTSCAKEEEEPKPTTPTFTGNWYISEQSTDNGAGTYYVTIADSSNATHILFSYLYGFNKKTYATVSGSNFTIPTQTIQGLNISGTGTLANANHINMKYLVQTTGTHYDTVTAVLTK